MSEKIGGRYGSPVVLAFAGPNGSGKSTVTRGLQVFGTYINADDLKKEYHLTDLEAARQAEALRNEQLSKKGSFSFETVLSTERNLRLLQKASELGYEIQCVYVLTCNEDINVARVRARAASGGHDVPEEKIRERYHRALKLLPQVIAACDKILVYDNSDLSGSSLTSDPLFPCLRFYQRVNSLKNTAGKDDDSDHNQGRRVKRKIRAASDLFKNKPVDELPERICAHTNTDDTRNDFPDQIFGR
jgi:predicted ABC-type ATPase